MKFLSNYVKFSVCFISPYTRLCFIANAWSQVNYHEDIFSFIDWYVSVATKFLSENQQVN